jgi:toxin ParE1/3/4
VPGYRLTKSAGRDVVAIWKHIGADNIRAADALYEMLHGKFSALAASPLIGVAATNMVRGLRKFPVGNYLIYYRVTRGTIIVTRILHGKRQQKRAYGRA